MKILIVDDRVENLYMLEVVLKSAGFEVVSAKNGVEALEQLRADRFNGIVSDILMPGMDGFRLIRECKEDPRLRQIPFIFYTATYTEKKDQEFGLSLGAVRYIIKPAEPEDLLRQIREVFSNRAQNPVESVIQPGPDEVSFSREYSRRIGAKLDKKERDLRESEEKYRLIYEYSMDAILLSSPDGTILAANPAACAMFQRTEEEIIGIGREGLIDISDSRLPAALEERTRTGRFTGELTFFRKDGTRFAGEVSSSVFSDRHGDKRTGMIIRDISERREHERALQIANQKLNLMNIVAWHDIYNKITGCWGYVELIKEHITDKDAEEFLTSMTEILKVIQRQISFTREYQEMGRQPSDWYNLGNLLEKVLGTGVAGSIHVTNEAENLEIFADPVIEKVFWHLIDNSKKHGEKVTNIRIFAAESASGCTLVYQDDGIGIPQDMKNKLFTRSADKITGFDLFMVHDILDICEMKIAETGEPGTGVKFEISIPGGRYRLVGI
jgi:PAS domain S-box-containing protein